MAMKPEVRLTGIPQPRPEYHTVVANDEKQLDAQVMAWMLRGWKPHGGPVMRQADGTFYQAMVRP